MNPLIPGLDLPVRTIFCIGRNYAAHARELGSTVPDSPVIFLKPVSAVCFSGDSIELPKTSHRVDHEVEVVVAIGRGGKNIPETSALSHVAGYGIGIDVTARDLQEVAKKGALPWTICKGFDTFAPLGRFAHPSKVADPGKLSFELRLNGEVRQTGNTSRMIFSIPQLISFTSTIFTLAPGDLIFTGTPEGVSPISHGDLLTANLGDGLSKLEVRVR